MSAIIFWLAGWLAGWLVNPPNAPVDILHLTLIKVKLMSKNPLDRKCPLLTIEEAVSHLKGAHQIQKFFSGKPRSQEVDDHMVRSLEMSTYALDEARVNIENLFIKHHLIDYG